MSPAHSPDPLALVLERLDRIEAALVRLSAAPAAPAPAAGAKRLTAAQALDALQVCRTTLRGYVARGLLTELRPSGRKGPNSRVYFLPDEVAALALGEDHARELMARKRMTRRAR